MLQKAGWTRAQIREALSSFAEVDFPVPVPRPRPYLDARNAFIYRLEYMTLFVAAGVIIGDVVTLIYNLLGGEITIRFMLKVLVVAFIAGSVFWYYLPDIRREE